MALRLFRGAIFVCSLVRSQFLFQSGLNNGGKTPSTNFQAPEKFQGPSSKACTSVIEVWRLMFLWCLEVGAWNFRCHVVFDFGIRANSPPIELAEQSGGGGKVGIERKGALRGDARGVDVSQSRQNRGPRIRRAGIGRISRFSTEQ